MKQRHLFNHYLVRTAGMLSGARRTAKTLLVMLMLMITAQSAWAQSSWPISEVKLLGASAGNIDALKNSYKNNGWTIIDKDLNDGAGGDYILLAYKREQLTNTSGGYITDFYISNQKNPSSTVTSGGKTYSLCSYDGDSDFRDSKGDLNNNASGDYIYLYYTKEIFSSKLAVYDITFNTTQSGAVGVNGSTSTGYDLNTGAGGADIYMHLSTISEDWSGSGTSASPYIINTPFLLNLLSLRVNAGTNYEGKYFKVDANISMSGVNFKPIGSSDKPFKGSFNGSGKTISNITASRDQEVGLFGYTDKNSTVENVILSSSTFSGGLYIGGIVGLNYYGTIRNCRVESSVSIKGNQGSPRVFGGIVGYNDYGSVIGCVSAASISRNGQTGTCKSYGGITGVNHLGTILDCLYIGTTIDGDNNQGAIAGENYSGSTYKNNYYTNISRGAVEGADVNGARKALTIGKTSSVTVTPVGTATTYNVSGITVYADNTGIKYNNTLYAGETESVKFTINYSGTLSEGYILSFTDGNGHELTKNNDGSYTLTMPSSAPTVTQSITKDWYQFYAGTSDDPYIISTPAELNLLASRINADDKIYYSKHYKLGCDIDMTGVDFTPIGKNGATSFLGYFDGGGHTISGITLSGGENEYASLFGLINPGSVVENVIIDNCTFANGLDAGGIAAVNGGTIRNCHVKSGVTVNSISDSGGYGGIAGRNTEDGTIEGCISFATVSCDHESSNCLGGIVGKNEGIITDCLYSGNSITGSGYKGAISGVSNPNLFHNYYTATDIGGNAASDRDGARKALTIDKASNVTITPVGTATTYSTSKITAYANNWCVIFNNLSFYAGATETVYLNISYSGSVPDGKALAGYTDGNGHQLIANTDGTYTLTMPSTSVTITPFFADDWASKNTGDTKDDAYVISTPSDLDLLAKRVNAGEYYRGKYFKLANDITFSHTTDWNDASSRECNYTPIGYYTSVNGQRVEYPFGGDFDGQGHTISGIRFYTEYTDGEGVGLFGFIYAGAVVHDIILADTRITGFNNVGGIAGLSNEGTVSNCWVKDNVALHASMMGSSFFGGIVGDDMGTVEGCLSSVTITKGNFDSSYYFGGITGSQYKNKLCNNLVINASISATKTEENSHGAILGRLNLGTIFARNYYVNCTVAGVADATNVGCNGADCDGARKAFAIGAADGVTITPEGTTTNYSVSGITTYADNSGMSCGGTLYAAAATESVTLNISYSVPEGYLLAGYTDGNGNALTANADGSYTLAMTDAAPTITPNLIDDWASKNSGTKDDPYTISTPEQLNLLSQRVNGGEKYSGKYFKLGADIDMSGVAFTPIGKDWSIYFAGNFDGDGKTISGITVNGTEQYIGLFGMIAIGTVENLILSNSTFSGPGHVGGIAGFLDNGGTIRNCRVEGSVSIVASQDNSLSLGGVVGYISKGSTVIGCVSAATVSAGDYSDCRYFGGIAGSSDGTIQDCLYTGTSVSGADFMGAIVGWRYEDGILLNNKYTAIDLGGVGNGIYSYDIDGARKALTIGAADGVTVTPVLNNALTYDVSGITHYGSDSGMTYDGTFYIGATEEVQLNISYSGNVPEGQAVAGYTDGSYHKLAYNRDGSYTLTMPDEASDITPFFVDDWAKENLGDTKDAPYIISTPEDLNLLSQRVNGGEIYPGKYFKLGADIDMSGVAFTPIGKDGNNYFGGNFNGDGKTISGITVNGTEQTIGLFGMIAFGTVENLILSNSTFSGPGGVGGIAGLLGNDGTIRNCRVEGSVSIVASQDNSLSLGGVVGSISNVSTVIGCVSAATVSAGDYSYCWAFGGIAGSSDGTIQDCLYTGTSVSGADNMGAIVGWRYEYGILLNNKYTAIDLGGVGKGIDSYDIDGARNALAIGAADGVTVTPLGDATTYDVSGITTYAGYGYIGCGDTIYFDGSVQTMTLNISYSGVPEGKVISYSDGNGNALTANADGTYTLTMNDAAVTITPDFWSVVDGRDGSTAEKAYIITTTDGLDYLAAMVNRGTRYEDTYFELGADIAYDGSLENNFTPIGCFSDDTANKFYGHFDGKGHTISGIRIKQGDGSRSHNYQALFGYTSSTAVICNLTLADTRIVGNDYSGGIVGYNDGGTITNCHATATVSILTPAIITYFHGGIVGSNHNGTVTGCTSAATVSSDGYDNIEDYGILVGYNNGGTIQDCFVYGGAVSGTKYVGAIVGEDKSGTLINNYHTLSDVGGVGIKDKVTGSDMAGALQALAIGTADGLAITPLGDATTYDVSGITVYSGNSGIIYHGTLYAGATEQVTFTISYSVPTGYEFIAYTDGNGNALGVSELGDSYLLTMTDVAATVTPIVKKRLENLFSGSNAWTGYVSEEDLALPDGLTAYVISALGDETATATEIEYIPQGMAVLLRRDNTEVNLYLASAGSGSEPGDNLLRAASPTSQPTAYRDYILFRDAFVLASEGTLATGKVYLPVQGNSKSRATACTIVIDGETTSLREVNGEEAETGAWYDLQGRKYDGKPTKKGVYIHNGKKVAIK